MRDYQIAIAGKLVRVLFVDGQWWFRAVLVGIPLVGANLSKIPYPPLQAWAKERPMLIWYFLIGAAGVFALYLAWRLAKALTPMVRPTAIELFTEDTDSGAKRKVRVRLQNISDVGLEGLICRIARIDGDDPIRQLTSIDYPLNLYSQKRTDERAAGKELRSCRFDLDAGMPKSIDLFYVAEAHMDDLVIEHEGRTIKLISTPMKFRLELFGAGAPTRFTIDLLEHPAGVLLFLESDRGMVIGSQSLVRALAQAV